MAMQQAANELHEPIIQLLENLNEENSSFKDKNWSVDLADIKLINKNNKRIRHLLCLLFIILSVNMDELFP